MSDSLQLHGLWLTRFLWIFQSRILEWIAVSSYMGSSPPRDRTCDSCIGRQILYLWATHLGSPGLWQWSLNLVVHQGHLGTTPPLNLQKQNFRGQTDIERKSLFTLYFYFSFERTQASMIYVPMEISFSSYMRLRIPTLKGRRFRDFPFTYYPNFFLSLKKYFIYLPYSLSIYNTHTHTHTHFNGI